MRLLVSICYTLLSSLAFAAGEGRPVVTDASSGAGLAWRASQKGAWVTNGEGARILRFAVAVEAPADLARAPITEASDARVRAKGRQWNFSASKQATRFQLANQAVLVTLASTGVFEENCAAEKLTLRPLGTAAPFYLGAACTRANDEVSFHLSFAADVDLTQSTLFEAKGKSENWRVYELKRNTASGELGRFTFTYAGRPYVYELASLRDTGSDTIATKTSERRFSLGAGYVMTSFANTKASDVDAKPLLLAKLHSRPLWYGVSAGAQGAFALPLSSSSKSISYLQAELFLDYPLTFGAFVVAPRVSYVLSNQQHAGSNVGYQTSQVGAGAEARWLVSSDWSTSLEFMTESIGSSVIQTHQRIDANVMYRSYGAGLVVQSYSVIDAARLVSKFSQTLVYGSYSF